MSVQSMGTLVEDGIYKRCLLEDLALGPTYYCLFRMYLSPLDLVSVNTSLLSLKSHSPPSISVQSNSAVQAQALVKVIVFLEIVYVPLQRAGNFTISLSPLNIPFVKVNSTADEFPFRSKTPTYSPLMLLGESSSLQDARPIKRQKSIKKWAFIACFSIILKMSFF